MAAKPPRTSKPEPTARQKAASRTPAASPQRAQASSRTRRLRQPTKRQKAAAVHTARPTPAEPKRPVLLVLVGILAVTATVVLISQFGPAAPASIPEPTKPAASETAAPAQSLQSQPLETEEPEPVETEPPETEPAGPFPDLLAEYTSPNYGGYNRTINLQLACEALDGAEVAPGAVFSFNETVGERTEEKGYLPASIYSAGTTTDEIGGGICQVASTLYLVSMKANMQIVERRCHQFTVNYLPLGMDAAIYWDGGQDLQFRNSSEYAIRINASAEGGYVNVAIWGTKTDDTYIEMEYEILETYEPEEMEEIAWLEEPGYSELKTTGITGYYVQTYRCVYDAEGNLLSRTEEDTSNYFKRDQVTLVGPPESSTTPPNSAPPISDTPPTQPEPAQTDPSETSAPAPDGGETEP